MNVGVRRSRVRHGGDDLTMRRGSRHHWAYHGHWYEKKVGPGRWRIDYAATKRQKPRSGVRRGSRYVWDIHARQYAVKTRSGQYQTRMKGYKTLVQAKPKIHRMR